LERREKEGVEGRGIESKGEGDEWWVGSLVVGTTEGRGKREGKEVIGK